MFGFSPVGHVLQMLSLLTFQILQVFCTYKDNLIRDWCVTLCLQSTNVLHTPIRFIHPFGQKQGFPLIISNIQTIIKVGILTIWLYLMCASASLASWTNLEFHSYANLEVSYIFCKVPMSHSGTELIFIYILY